MKSKSKSEILDELASIEERKIYRDWWRFQYTNRHFKQLLLVDEHMNKKVDHALRWLTQTFDKFKAPLMYPSEEDLGYLKDLFEFTNCLVYAYHKRTQLDGFLDFRYEILLYEHDYPLETLPPDEIQFVEYLHELTVEFGFLVSLLDFRPDYTKSWELFINKVPDFDLKTRFVQLFPYPKRGDNPKGVQICTVHHPREVEDIWDMVIYCSLDDVFSHLKKEVRSLWGESRKVEVGKPESHDFALFVEREKCTLTSVLKVLRLQAKWSLLYQEKRAVSVFDKIGNRSSSDVPPNKKLSEIDSNLLDAIRLSEGLIEKQKDLRKDNVRRAVGLYLWDLLQKQDMGYESKDSLIKGTIQKLEDEAPFVLDCYRAGYKKLGGTQEAYNTVIREMRKDIELTDYGIQYADFFTSNQIKNARKGFS